MPCQWLRYHCRAVVARLHSGFGLVGSPGAENIHVTKYLAAMARGPMGAPGAGCTRNEVSRILRTRCRFSCESPVSVHLRLLVVQVQVHSQVQVQLQAHVQVQVQVQGGGVPFALQFRVYFPFGSFFVYVQLRVFFWCMLWCRCMCMCICRFFRSCL